MIPYPSAFGMTSDPFSKGRRAGIVVETEEFAEVKCRLNYLKELRGFGLLTGSPGSGKTTSLRSWSQSLPSSSYQVTYLNLTSVTPGDFYRDLASQLGLQPSFRKIENYRLIQQELRRLSEEKSITPVIIIDEAADLDSRVLGELKTIFSFDMDSRNKAIVIFSGLPAFSRILNMNANEPLRQRIVMNCHIEGLSPEGTADYIKKKVSAVKGSEDLFTVQAISAISNASGGIPRLIDQICTRCLILGSQTGEEYINHEIVYQAVDDLHLE